MATTDLIPLFLAAQEPHRRGIGRGGHRAVVIASCILFAAGAAIVFTVLSAGNPLVLFTNATASVSVESAPQDGTGRQMPIVQSTSGGQALAPTAEEAFKNDDSDAAFKTAGETEIREPPAEALLKQFQAWATEEDARAEVQPMQPVDPVQSVQPVQDAGAEGAQNARAEVSPVQEHRQIRSDHTAPQVRSRHIARARVKPEHAARAEVLPVRNSRGVRPEQKARSEVRPLRTARPQLLREQDARAQVRPEQNTPAEVSPEQNVQGKWPFGWLN
jgi:hypothetical protein